MVVLHDVVRELNMEALKVQYKLNKVYKNVKRCKLIATMSSGISLGLLFKNPQVALVFGGVATAISIFSEYVNSYSMGKFY